MRLAHIWDHMEFPIFFYVYIRGPVCLLIDQFLLLLFFTFHGNRHFSGTQFRSSTINETFDVSLHSIAPWGIPCHVAHCYSSLVSQLERTIDWSPHLAAFIIFSGTMRARTQEGQFQVTSSLNLVGAVYKECCVSSIRELTVKHWEATRDNHSWLSFGKYLDYPD